MPAKKRPLWTCPRCGHRFVTRNMWHSCGRYRLADHFKGKDPALRKLFDRFRALVRKSGPVTVYAQKTRIIFQTRARFTGFSVKKHWLDGAFWFKRRVEHPRFYRIELIPPGDYIHRFRLTKLSEIDGDLAAFVREAYAVGRQELPEAPKRPL
jgi:hypothetical protein